MCDPGPGLSNFQSDVPLRGTVAPGSIGLALCG